MLVCPSCYGKFTKKKIYFYKVVYGFPFRIRRSLRYEEVND